LLSALVVKGSFFIVVRLWFDVMPQVPGPAAMQVLAGLGVGAILFGSIEALRQRRLKLLIAYSTVAQIGYLFLMFPLAFPPGSTRIANGGALAGGMLQAMSHASAKAAMFMAAGLIYAELGHDRIAGLAGVARTLPMSVFAFGLAGLALIGVPPSGAYLAKDLLLGAAAQTSQWWWAVAIQAGGALAAGYVLLVIMHAVAPRVGSAVSRRHVPYYQEAAALVLALCSLLLGLVPWGNYLPLPQGTLSNPLTLSALLGSVCSILAGAVLAILLGRWDPRLNQMPFTRNLFAAFRPVRRAGLRIGRITAELDARLRQWPVAGACLLIVLIVFGMALDVVR